MHARQFSLIMLALVSSVVSSVDIEKCRMSDEECLARVANEVLKQHVKGIEDINLPSLDPLLINELAVIQDLNAVKIDARIVNTDMLGFSTAKIEKIKGFDTGEVEIRFVIANGGFFGPYKVKGKLLKLAIEGKGDMKITFKNFKAIMKFKVTNKTVDGRTYLHGENPWMTLSITGGSAHLSHLGSIANSFLNWSFVVIVNAVKDTFCVPMSGVMLEKINAMLDNVPVDELFLT